jgi:hypothetical protein
LDPPKENEDTTQSDDLNQNTLVNESKRKINYGLLVGEKIQQAIDSTFAQNCDMG